MNNVSNNDSEQCTESKLGWVHRVHTQWTLAGRTLRAHSAQAGRVATCRGRTSAVSQHVVGRVVAVSQACRYAHASLSKLPSVTIQVCIAISYLPRAVSHACPAVSQPLHDRVVACLATKPSSQASSCHNITNCIVTHSPVARPPSCHDTTIVS